MNRALLSARTLWRVALALSTLGAACGAEPSPSGGPDNAAVAAALTPEGGTITVEAKGMPAPAPLFFSASVEQELRVGTAEILGEMHLKLHILQGKPEVLTLGLSGDGEVTDVSGAGLRDWSVRQAAGARLLDLRPILLAGMPALREMDIVVHTRVLKPVIPGEAALLILTPGEAVGFASTLAIETGSGVDLRVTRIAGLLALDNGTRPGGAAPEVLRFTSTGEGALGATLTERGAAPADAELTGAQLSGTASPAGGSVDFRLKGLLHVAKAGSPMRLLAGRAALSDGAAGDGWHVELVPVEGGHYAYDLVGDRVGVVPVDLAFAAQVREDGDWKALDFTMPAGAVVPVQLEGLGAEATFRPGSAIMPAAAGSGWRGFLPANGVVSLSWTQARTAQQGVLAFTSFELDDVHVGAGLLRQSAQITFRVLQGKLGAVACRLEGPGEILGVEGANVVGWKVVPDGAARRLEVSFSRPLETEGSISVTSQQELGGFPVRAEAMRIVPVGGVRHSGFLRVANTGSVRLEVADTVGMMQLAPAQYPGPAETARQVFVYRFPAAAYGYRVVASEIQPEVGVLEIATYELSETDRVISASLELDVREAPLRDWSLQIPDDYTVASVEGSGVADYSAEAAPIGGYRTLKVLFGRPVEGRELLQLRLEKNQPAAAGDWPLRPLRFAGAKTVRGHIGVVSTPGYRLVPAQVTQLVEVPLSYFPRQVAGLQQAWRLRDPDWSAGVRVEALGQSIQADVFHLYSIKEGVVYGSVLLNYFVVGAPANEWRIEIPASVGNIDVVGQNVQRDWRREGNQLIVSLHQPVLGGSTLLVTFEQPMSARGGVIEPGQVRPIGVQAERGYVEVVSPLQVKFDVRRAEGGLIRLEPMELPAEFRLLSSSPALAVYQYTARPFRLEMGLEWYAQAETADQVIDFARLSSHVSRDGQVVTDAQYYVKTHGRKALRLVIPPGVRLWETRVDNEVTSAQVDGADTLIPLPAHANPNEPVSVTLRLGQAANSTGSDVSLLAPRMLAATVISEWTLRGDPGLVLVPRGGTASLVRPTQTETGFEWIATRGTFAVASLLSVIALASLLLLSDSTGRLSAGLACSAAAMVGASILAAQALLNRRVNLRELTYASTMVAPSESVTIHVGNVAEWRGLLVGWGIAAVVAGVALWVLGLRSQGRARRACVPAAAILLSAGLLAQHGGAALFFAAASLAVFTGMFVPAVSRWQSARRAARPLPAGPGASAVLPLLVLLGITGLSFGTAPAARAEEAAPWIQDGSKAAQAMVETWSIRNNRVFAEVDLTVRGNPGDSFLLLSPPAVLTGFSGDGLRLGKVDRDGRTSYFVAPERAGLLTAHAHFEMPLGEAARSIPVPTGPAAAQRITLELDQGGWEFTSPMAAQVLPTPGLGDGHSGATLVLSPIAAPRILLQPRHRDLATEATRFYAEASNLYIPGPGVVDGFARVTIRPVQGRVGELELEIPKGLTVGDVVRGPVGAWRFDPLRHRLHVTIGPAQAETFRFDVQTQLGTGALPVSLELEALKVQGAEGQVGTLAVAFGSEAQPEAIAASGLSPVNVADFEADLVPRGGDNRPLATLQDVWRYGQSGGRVTLTVAAVAPEVRVASREVLSLDDDRLVTAVDLNVSIARAGLFKLSFALPEGLEIEALSGSALSQWTEASERGRRIVTMHLNGRTLGEKTFALTLAGPAPHAQDAWAVPGVVVREAARQTGEALLVPGKGLRLRVADREKVTQIDPASAGGLQPGTLAFRLLQGDWSIHVGIEALDPWVTVQSLQEVTVREGQTLTRIGLRYRVENAAVKQFRIRLPGLGEERARTVRATGSAVSDMVRVPGSPDLWDIRFQRGIAGETDVQIEFQGPTAHDADRETVATPEFPGARQAVQFVAVRGSGRLELEAEVLPKGWAKADWAAVASNLQASSDRSVPTLCFRVAEPEGPLAVTVVRHELAEALKLRVTRGDLTTVFSPGGSSLTSVDLRVDVLEKSTLRVRLPVGARLFNTLVNGESVSVVREAEAFLFHVAASSDAEHAATVRLVYASASPGDPVDLAAPGLSIPLENVTWHVVLPPGYELARYRGGLVLRQESFAGFFGIDQYRSQVDARRSADARKAVAMLEEANAFLQSGDQQRAGEMLSRASNAQLDEASNEDARVQLRILKTEQTVLGLNTRRQRVYLDNRVDSARNEQLEQAASVNPFMKGKVNFDPQQVDQLLMGNTAEENASLRGIAAHLVDQQLAAEPAPGAIDVAVPERGRVLTFTRSLQVDGGAPLELRLTLARASAAHLRFSLLAMLAIGTIAMISLGRKAPSR